MALDITKIPSGQTYQLADEIANIGDTPTILITGNSPMLDEGGVLAPELVIHATVELNTDGSTKSESFYVGSPVDKGDGTYEYTTIVRNLKNDIKIGTPTIADSKGSGSYKAHAKGAAVVVDPTITLRAMDSAFKTNVANRFVQFTCFDKTTTVTVGDGRNFFVVPAKWNGDSLAIANGTLTGVDGSATIQIENVTQGYDMLSTAITFSGTSTGSGVVDATKASLTTGDVISVNIDTADGTATGLQINLETSN